MEHGFQNVRFSTVELVRTNIDIQLETMIQLEGSLNVYYQRWIFTFDASKGSDGSSV